MPLEVQPTVQLSDVIRFPANGNAVGPHGAYVELLQIALNTDLTLRQRPVDIVVST